MRFFSPGNRVSANHSGFQGNPVRSLRKCCFFFRESSAAFSNCFSREPIAASAKNAGFLGHPVWQCGCMQHKKSHRTTQRNYMKKIQANNSITHTNLWGNKTCIGNAHLHAQTPHEFIRYEKCDGISLRAEISDIPFPFRSPSPQPHADPTQHPEKDPKRTRNGPERTRNVPKRTRNGPKSSSLWWDGRGVCRDGGVGVGV